MPRQRLSIGPLVKVDAASLRALPADERLRLLTRMTAECGGLSEDEWTDRFRNHLANAKASGSARLPIAPQQNESD